MKKSDKGSIYVVATPLGHLGDITFRAIEILKSVDLVAAEDTRKTQGLLSHYGIRRPLVSLHGHNEAGRSSEIIQRCLDGQNIALVSDAGTPLISDPGQYLIAEASQVGLTIVPIPGPCAAIAALSVSGLDTSRFIFEGFLPARKSRREKRLQSLSSVTETMVFYESKHRFLTFMQELCDYFGNDREAVIGRELTKQFEQVKKASLKAIHDYFSQHSEHLKGEFVVIVSGCDSCADGGGITQEHLLRELLGVLSASKAASVVARLTGQSKQAMYQLALDLQARKNLD
jgi:16S rRNA (cytidine1402-2'-O)-methyltransferase